jgi:hypothetical protein
MNFIDIELLLCLLRRERETRPEDLSRIKRWDEKSKLLGA